MWDLGGEGSRIDASAHAMADLLDAEDLDEYTTALLKLTKKELADEVEKWRVHLESMRTNNPMQMHRMDDQKGDSESGGPLPFSSPFADNKTFRDLSLRVRLDVVLAACHFRLGRHRKR